MLAEISTELQTLGYAVLSLALFALSLVVFFGLLRLSRPIGRLVWRLTDPHRRHTLRHHWTQDPRDR